jgi:hypothetical protein
VPEIPARALAGVVEGALVKLGIEDAIGARLERGEATQAMFDAFSVMCPARGNPVRIEICALAAAAKNAAAGSKNALYLNRSRYDAARRNGPAGVTPPAARGSGVHVASGSPSSVEEFRGHPRPQ